MTATRIQANDRATINAIIENLLDQAGSKPSANHLEKLLTDDRTYLFAAMLEQEVIGYALAYRFPSLYASGYLAYLYDIEVLKTHRRKGAGRLLMRTLLTHLKLEGVTELWLGTATNNVEGQALFSATGGARSGETFNDFTYEI